MKHDALHTRIISPLYDFSSDDNRELLDTMKIEGHIVYLNGLSFLFPHCAIAGGADFNF